jgi:hypothetical protein
MHGYLDTAGERVAIECGTEWIEDLIVEGAAGELLRGNPLDPSMSVVVEDTREPFDIDGWRPLTRGAWERDGAVVVENVCTAGFDLLLRPAAAGPEFTYRWRPPRRDHAAAWVLRSRFHLLARAVIVQFPALWWAGTRGRPPLHASACTVGPATPLLVGPSGVGRSTLVLEELAAGGHATGDNLAVGDGTTSWGLVEPLRIEGGAGRRMPHGRKEEVMPQRVRALDPDCLIVLERGGGDVPSLLPCSREHAVRSLVTSTYMAGELRRFWAFAATLSAGTGLAPPHPPVTEIASAFAARLRCLQLTLPRTPGTQLSQLLGTSEPLEVAS